MRRLMAVIALMALALPAAAQDNLVIDFDDGNVESWTNETPVVHWGIAGHYLWLEWGDPDRLGDSESPDIVSVDISDPTITQVVARPDGTVDITREMPEPEPETVDVVEEFPEVDWSFLIPFGVYPK